MQFAGIIFFTDFEKLLQINYLMIAPVADVRPWVVGLDGFPVKTVFCNAIRIVAVES